MAWLVLIVYQTQTAAKMLGATPRWRERIDWRPAGPTGQTLLGGQLLGRNLARGAFLVRILDLGPEVARLIHLAL